MSDRFVSLWNGLLTVGGTLYQGTAAAGDTSSQDNMGDMSPDSEPADTLQEVRTKEEGQLYLAYLSNVAIMILPVLYGRQIHS